MSHYIDVCTCGAVLSQCRCMGPHKERRVYNGCSKCKSGSGEALSPFEDLFNYDHPNLSGGLISSTPAVSASVEKTVRAFHLNRLIDASGISGTGIVAHGVEFADGQCALHWRDSGSIGIYPSLKKLEEIHGHQGRTLVVMS